MSLVDWMGNTASLVKNQPIRGSIISAKRIGAGVARRTRDPQGVNVFNREWDVCLVLDALRPDLMREVEDEYEWFDYEETIWSLGATSPEWIERTFDRTPDEVLSESAYVTWNGHSTTEEVDGDVLSVLDEVWAYGWDDEVGAVPPGNMSDRAISVWRENDLDRMVVHYMQPHVPFISAQDKLRRKITLDDHRGRTDYDRRIWLDLRDGIVSHEEVWEAYVDNLRLVLDDIEEKILDNLDAERVVITSDHGNGMGEWGVFGHGRDQPFAALHNVPWCTFEASDKGTYEPTLKPEDGQDPTESVAQERLSDLGYI